MKTTNLYLSEGYPKGSKIEYLYTFLKKTSKPCPYGVCGGDGEITNVFLDTELNKIIKNTTYCKCYFIPTKEELKEQAEIPKIFKNVSVSSFNTSLYADKIRAVAAKKAVANFVKNFKDFKQNGDGLYLFSKTKGSGKTRLACSIGNAIIETTRQRVKFIKTVDLLSTIRSTYRRDAEQKEFDILESFKKISILILDDIGVERSTDWVNEIFLSILDYRIINKLTTIFTSNLQQNELLLNERIVSRIKNMSKEIHLPEESIRQLLSNNKHQESNDILLS